MAKEQTPALAGLTSEQLQECLALGATLGEIKDLAESGFGYEAIAAIAPQMASARQNGGGQAQVTALLETMRKERRPENVAHEDKSARNPLGQRDHPNPGLPCKDVWFGGFPVHAEQCTRTELELLNQLQPGEYIVTRVDDQEETIPVGFIKDATGKLARINIGIKTGDEHKNAWPGLRRVLQEIVSQIPTVAA
jgi:hypothetical protein